MEPSASARAPALAKPDLLEFAQMWADPQRRRLFEEFLKTMSDPDERKKFETDFKELRKSLKKDKSRNERILLDPPASNVSSKPASAPRRIAFEPSFCVETSAVYLKDYHEETRHVFVNICASDEVGDYRAHLYRPCRHPHHGSEHHHSHECTFDTTKDDHHYDHDHDQDHTREQKQPAVEVTGGDSTDKSRDYMEIPYVSDLDYKSNEYRIYNFAFGTGSIRRATTQRDASFRELLIRTALQSLREKYDENIASDLAGCKVHPQGSHKQAPSATSAESADNTYPSLILKQNAAPSHCVSLQPRIFSTRDDFLEAALGLVDEQIFSFATEYVKSQLYPTLTAAGSSFLTLRASPTVAASVAVPACLIRQTSTHIIIIIEWSPPHGVDFFESSSCQLLLSCDQLCVWIAADQRKGLDLVLCLQFSEPIDCGASITGPDSSPQQMRCTVSERNIALALPKQQRHFWKQLLFKQHAS